MTLRSLARITRLAVAAATLMVGIAPSPAPAAPAGRACIAGCRQVARTCRTEGRTLLVRALGACGEDRTAPGASCRREARARHRAAAQACRSDLASCRACCRSGGDACTGPVAAAGWSTGAWAGHVDGGEAFVAIVAGERQLTAYVCDDGATAEWFEVTAPATSFAAASESGAALAATLRDGAVDGTVELVGGSRRRFRAEATSADVLFRTQVLGPKFDLVAGWIRLPGGAVRGAGVFKPGPSLDPLVPELPRTVIPVPQLSLGGDPVRIVSRVGAPLLPPFVDAPKANPVRPADPRPATPNEAVRFVWAGLGDSYGAGEGQPLVPGEFTLDYIPLELPVWGTPRPAIGADEDELRACHRSDLAGPPVADGLLRAEFPDVDFHFAHFACSGAVSFNLTHDGYPGTDRSIEKPQPAQLRRAAEFADDAGGYDAVYMSIGGNDAGFAPVVGHCITHFPPNHILDVLPTPECDEAPLTLSGIDGVPDGTSLEDALNRLPEVYEDLDAFLRGLGDDGLPVPEEVFISKYPDPTDSGDVVPCGGSAGNLEGDLLGLVSTKEATWARDVPLASFNAAIGNTTGLGWRVIQSHLEAFEGHGICTADHWFNNNHQALAKQGDDMPMTAERIGLGVLAALSPVALGLSLTTDINNFSCGMMHPNRDGHAAYGEAIYQALRPLVVAKREACLRLPGRPRVYDVTRNSRLMIIWNDHSSCETRYELRFTRLTGAGPVPAGLVELPANTQSYEIPLTVATGLRAEVRACTIDRCTAFAAAELSNTPPASPTGMAGGYLHIGPPKLTPRPFEEHDVVSVGWERSRFAEQYVVRYRQIDPAAAASEVVTPNERFSLLIEPGTSTDPGAPKALYGVKVAACNLAGCSAFSTELQVDARGTPTESSSPELPKQLREVPPDFFNGIGGIVPEPGAPGPEPEPGPGPRPGPGPDDGPPAP